MYNHKQCTCLPSQKKLLYLKQQSKCLNCTAAPSAKILSEIYPVHFRTFWNIQNFIQTPGALNLLEKFPDFPGGMRTLISSCKNFTANTYTNLSFAKNKLCTCGTMPTTWSRYISQHVGPNNRQQAVEYCQRRSLRKIVNEQSASSVNSVRSINVLTYNI